MARITLAAPGTGNALSVPVLDGLVQAIRRAIADPSCRVIVISAQGEHFCRGLDFAAAISTEGDLDRAVADRALECFTLLTSCPLPVIACVEGHVTGGGVGLVAACDLVLASPEATFMLPEVILGLIPAFIAPLVLRRVTPGRFRAMALGTRALRAVEARDHGLVDELAEDGTADAMEVALRRQLKRLLRSSPRALAETKRYIDALLPREFARQMEFAMEQFVRWVGQPGVLADARQVAEGESPHWFHQR